MVRPTDSIKIPADSTLMAQHQPRHPGQPPPESLPKISQQLAAALQQQDPVALVVVRSAPALDGQRLIEALLLQENQSQLPSKLAGQLLQFVCQQDFKAGSLLQLTQTGQGFEILQPKNAEQKQQQLQLALNYQANRLLASLPSQAELPLPQLARLLFSPQAQQALLQNPKVLAALLAPAQVPNSSQTQGQAQAQALLTPQASHVGGATTHSDSPPPQPLSLWLRPITGQQWQRALLELSQQTANAATTAATAKTLAANLASTAPTPSTTGQAPATASAAPLPAALAQTLAAQATPDQGSNQASQSLSSLAALLILAKQAPVGLQQLAGSLTYHKPKTTAAAPSQAIMPTGLEVTDNTQTKPSLALTQLLAQQLSLGSAGQGLDNPINLLFLPFWHQQQMQLVSFEQQRMLAADGSNKQRWRYRFFLQLQNMPELCAELDLGEQDLQLTLWSQDPGQLQSLHQQLPQLQERLQKMPDVQSQCQARFGMPPKAKAGPNHSQSHQVDLHA